MRTAAEWPSHAGLLTTELAEFVHNGMMTVAEAVELCGRQAKAVPQTAAAVGVVGPCDPAPWRNGAVASFCRSILLASVAQQRGGSWALQWRSLCCVALCWHSSRCTVLHLQAQVERSPRLSKRMASSKGAKRGGFGESPVVDPLGARVGSPRTPTPKLSRNVSEQPATL